LLVVSDGAPGLIRAIEECFPRSVRQRCLAHKLRNLQSKVPEDQWPEFKTRATACYQAASPALARMLRDEIAATYGAALPSALACLQDDFEACIAHLRFPLAHRRAIRTTNLLERLFGEERRRTKVIPHAFGERAVPHWHKEVLWLSGQAVFWTSQQRRSQPRSRFAPVFL
jgi:putative transposase